MRTCTALYTPFSDPRGTRSREELTTISVKIDGDWEALGRCPPGTFSLAFVCPCKARGQTFLGAHGIQTNAEIRYRALNLSRPRFRGWKALESLIYVSLAKRRIAAPHEQL